MEGATPPSYSSFFLLFQLVVTARVPSLQGAPAQYKPYWLSLYWPGIDFVSDFVKIYSWDPGNSDLEKRSSMGIGQNFELRLFWIRSSVVTCTVGMAFWYAMFVPKHELIWNWHKRTTLESSWKKDLESRSSMRKWVVRRTTRRSPMENCSRLITYQNLWCSTTILIARGYDKNRPSPNWIETSGCIITSPAKNKIFQWVGFYLSTF